MDYLRKLCDKKAKENNTICLNAYAIGIEDSKASQMLDFIQRISGEMLRNDFVLDEKWYEQAKQLIKEATEL